MARPLLDPPCTGWARDLPAPGDASGILEAFGDPPNHVDDVYLEFPRSTILWRGPLLLCGVLALGMAAASAIFYVAQLNFILKHADLTCLAIGVPMLGMWFGFALIRADLAHPLDEPIRFNRIRRKVYVYRYHHCWWRPFNNALWYVKPVVYDWEDLRAEEYVMYVPTVTFNDGVNIAVVRPGTNQVVDRFFLGHGVERVNYWKMAVAYMQSGPDVLPRFEYPPRDWNNEDPGLNLARRFAPKVQWPRDIDVESRTAP